MTPSPLPLPCPQGHITNFVGPISHECCLCLAEEASAWSERRGGKTTMTLPEIGRLLLQVQTKKSPGLLFAQVFFLESRLYPYKLIPSNMCIQYDSLSAAVLTQHVASADPRRALASMETTSLCDAARAGSEKDHHEDTFNVVKRAGSFAPLVQAIFILLRNTSCPSPDLRNTERATRKQGKARSQRRTKNIYTEKKVRNRAEERKQLTQNL